MCKCCKVMFADRHSSIFSGAAIAVTALIIWGVIAGNFWQAAPKVSMPVVSGIRGVLALAAIIYAICCFKTLYKEIATAESFAEYVKNNLIAIVAFWTLMPPIWFFIEYYYFDSGLIQVVGDLKEEIARTKAYADLASKVWAAVLALMTALFARAKLTTG